MMHPSALQSMLTLTGDQPAAIHSSQSVQYLPGCLHAVLLRGVQPQQVPASWAAPLGQLQGQGRQVRIQDVWQGGLLKRGGLAPQAVADARGNSACRGQQMGWPASAELRALVGQHPEVECTH